MSTRRQVISLYRAMMRESQKLSSYNFRMYAARKIRDTFRANQCTKDFEEIERQIEFGNKNLEIIRRQSIIGHLYPPGKLVIERPEKRI